jgi:CRISPR-associated protein (TIGR03986 family)
MTRSLLEIMSLGKFGPVSDRTMFYRSVGDRSSLGELYRDKFLDPLGPGKVEYPSTRIHGGYLVRKNDGWAICKAKQHHNETFIHVQYSLATPIIKGWGRHRVHPVWVRPAPRSESPGHGPRHNINLNMAVLSDSAQIGLTPASGLEKGFLVESGHMGRTEYDARRPDVTPRSPEKHMHCVVYEPDQDAQTIPIPDDLWRLYQEDKAMQRDANRTPRAIDENEPLFYRLDDQGALEFFGPTMMFRLPYRNTLLNRVPSQSIARDLAEVMFGTVSGGAAIKGRLFFEGARWRQGESAASPFYDDNGGLRSPKILGAPKPTAFQMYLEQPQPEYGSELLHWDSDGAAVRGWKRYWHRKLQEQAPGHEDSPFEEHARTDSTQHTIIRPVRPATMFSSRVRFENLNAIELGGLLTALDLPKSKCHHIGMGKPRGMGSVRIESTLHLVLRSPAGNDQSQIGEVGRQSRYQRMLNDDGTFCSGELDVALTAAAGNTCREAFERAITGKPGAFWSAPDTRELAAMLEWDRAPDPVKTRYMDLDAVVPNDAHANKWWRARPVLPLASEINQPALGGTPPPPADAITQTAVPPGTTSAPNTGRVVVEGETVKWASVRVTLTSESDLIRAARPGGGPPAEATNDDFAGFKDIAERLKSVPGRTAIARSVTIQRRPRMPPLIVSIDW